jgi:hypothetical protein
VIDEHAAAILALLDADNTAPALVVYDGKVPDGSPPPSSNPYVLVYFAAYDSETNRPLTLASQRAVVRAYCHSVGGNAKAARIVADRVRVALLDVVPTVAGRKCFPIRREDSQPPQRDESTGTTVMDQIDTYRAESIPG